MCNVVENESGKGCTKMRQTNEDWLLDDQDAQEKILYIELALTIHKVIHVSIRKFV